MIIYSPRFFIYGRPVLFINSTEGFFALLSSTRLFKSLSPSSRSWDKGKVTHIKRHFFVFISNSYFLCVSNSMFLFLSFVYVFPSQQTKRIRKKQIESNRIERKKRRLLNFAITLQNSGGKYIYGPPNFIYAQKKDIAF